MDFRSGKPSFLPPQRTAVPVKEKGVNDLPPSTSRTSRQKTDDLIRRFNEFKKPIFRDEPPKPQSPLTDPVIDSIFDDTFFTPPHLPIEDVLKPDLKPPLTNFNEDANKIEMIPKSIKNLTIKSRCLINYLNCFRKSLMRVKFQNTKVKILLVYQ